MPSGKPEGCLVRYRNLSLTGGQTLPLWCKTWTVVFLSQDWYKMCPKCQSAVSCVVWRFSASGHWKHTWYLRRVVVSIWVNPFHRSFPYTWFLLPLTVSNFFLVSPPPFFLGNKCKMRVFGNMHYFVNVLLYFRISFSHEKNEKAKAKAKAFLPWRRKQSTSCHFTM